MQLLLTVTEMDSEPFPSPLVAPDSEDLWVVDVAIYETLSLHSVNVLLLSLVNYTHKHGK